MRYRFAIIAYRPHSTEVCIRERTDNPSWADRFSCVVDPMLVFTGKATREQETLQMLIDFVTAAVLDGVSVSALDSEFKKLDEYRELLVEQQVEMTSP